MTKAIDIIFDGKPENWQAFEYHLVKESGNPTISWSNTILGFQIMGQCPVITLLKTFYIPPNMISGLQDDLKDTKEGDLGSMNTKLYKLKALNTKLPNCLTHSFGNPIEEPIPLDISNSNGRIYFCLIILRIFPYKYAHK
jgi:hypothetical protein